MNEVIRTFHPVGQGAFYSEQFIQDGQNTGLVVYDCGSGTSKMSKNLKKYVSNSLPKRDIDILFVSHFDNDHINGIQILKSSGHNIKNVVLPLVPPEIKPYVVLCAGLMDGKEASEQIRQILYHPEDFFGDLKENIKANIKANIIYVKSAITEQHNDNNKQDEPRSIENLSGQIESGTKITLGNQFPITWVYIPFNYEENQRVSEFKKLINDAIAQHDLPPTFDPNKDDWFDDTTLKNKIQKLYNNKIFGPKPKKDKIIHTNSLMVYSGTHCRSNYRSDRYNCVVHDCCCCPCRCPKPRYYSEGCLYLGDVNLNVTNQITNMIPTIKTAINQYVNRIGLIQIPHHGAHGSYNSDILELAPHCKHYVLSYGTTNTYGHPAPCVVSSIISQGYSLALVNENICSMFMQRIELKR